MNRDVKSAGRVIDIFEFFADRQCPATLTEICKRLDLPASSATMLLKTLVGKGYLDYDRKARTYLPTIRTALLGIWLNDMLLNDGTILRLMCDLRDRTGQTVTLAVQSGLSVQYIKVVPSNTRPTSPKVLTGKLRPLLRSAVGYALLSLKTEPEVLLLARRINAEEKRPDKIVRTQDLLAHIEGYRRDGYAYTEQATSAGAAIVATLIAAPPHQPPLALGIGGPIDQLRAHKQEYAQALKEVAEIHLRNMEGAKQTFH